MECVEVKWCHQAKETASKLCEGYIRCCVEIKWFGGVSAVQQGLQRSVATHSTRRFLTAQLVEAAGCVKALSHMWCLNSRSFVFSRTLAFRRLQSWSSSRSFLDVFVFVHNNYDVHFDDVATVDWSWLHDCQDGDQLFTYVDLFAAGAAKGAIQGFYCSLG